MLMAMSLCVKLLPIEAQYARQSPSLRARSGYDWMVGFRARPGAATRNRSCHATPLIFAGTFCCAIAVSFTGDACTPDSTLFIFIAELNDDDRPRHVGGV
jgi:hypothetical protein